MSVMVPSWPAIVAGNITQWDLTVDGVQLANFARYIVESGTILDPMPGIRAPEVVVPGAHGVIPVTGADTFEAGSFVVKLVVIGEDYDTSMPFGSNRWGEYDSALDFLKGLFGTRHHLLDVRRTMGDGSVRRAWARCSDAFTPDPIGAGVARLNVALQIPAVFWEDTASAVFTGTPGATSPHSEIVTTLTGGTAPVEDAVLAVVGPATNPRISQPDTGAYVTLAGAVPAGQVWQVDSGEWTSVLNGANVVAATSYGNSGARFLTLIPTLTAGSTRQVALTLSGSGFASSTNLTVTARRKFF